jgi:trimethylamine--corrinoid protein Co-methyltransferase
MKGLHEGSHFLGLRHTAENVKKELFVPVLSERNSRNTWLKKGAVDIFKKARIKTRELLDTHESYALPTSIEQEIDKYIKKVEERNINEYLNKEP